MTQEKDSNDKFSVLRSQAEELLGPVSVDQDDISALSTDEIQRLVHELRVHQIELEMQNEELRRAHHKLEELKNKYLDNYLDLYDLAPVGYMTLNDKGLILEANLTAVGLLGMERKSLIKMFFSRFVCHEFGDALFLYLQQVFESQSKQTCEIKLTRKDGTLFYAQLESISIQDESEHSIRCRTILTDITDRKQAEQRILGVLAYAENIVNTVREPLVVLDGEMRVISANHSFYNMFRVTLEETKGNQLYDLGNRQWDIPRLHELLEEILPKKTEVRDFEVVHIFPEIGHKFMYLNARQIVQQEGEEARKLILVAIEDITDRKRLEEELEQSEEKFRTVADFTFDWEYWIGPDGRLIYNSPSCERITGYRSDEFINNPSLLQEIIHPEDQSLVGNHFHTIDSGDSHQVEFRIVTRSGETHWIGHICQAVHGEDGTWLGRRINNRDITKRKRAEEEKDNLRAQLLQSQKMATMGTLAAGIAHDFNNMLQVIFGYSDMLLSHMNEGDPGHKGLQCIVKTAEDAADLVQRIRIFGRKAEMNLIPLNLNRQIDEVTKLLSHTLPKMIEMDILLAKDPVIIKADPSQITQMLMNLAINANEAMPQGGRLSIQTENIVLDDDYCRLHVGVKPGSHVMLTVSDTGLGIDKSLMERIFDPFYSTKARDYHKGTGLGLSVVQGIVHQHGGHITVESEVGRGTTFRMYFPALEVEKVPEYVEKKIPYPAGGTETILLVEDMDLARELGVTNLEKFGYTVLSAGDGQEALDVYEKEQGNISLVILDILMPSMDGKQCLEQLLRINPSVKVIISSGVGQEDLIIDVVEIGAKGSVNKPYSMRQLLHMVREVLDGD